MSRTPKPHGRTPAVVSESPASGAVARSAAATVSSPPHPLLLKLSVGAVLLWSLALAALAMLTANPPPISRDQLRRADAVVTARLDEGRSDRIRVERVLAGGLSPDDIVTVLNLPEESELSSSVTCVVPLTHFRRDYLVTTLDGQRVPPLIYPATPETIGEVKRILRDVNK